MKTLTLIRHAKSSWDHHDLRDHDRPLNDRGERAAPLVGRALVDRGIRPDAIVVSSAVRARATAAAIAAELGIPESGVIEETRIYAAGVATLFEVVTELDEGLASAILVGHNPGFHDFANTLLPGDPIDDMPTCAVVHMSLSIDHWALADTGCARLIDYFYPKMLA